MNAKDEVLRAYALAYAKYAAANISHEEAAIAFKEAGTAALNAGVTVTQLKTARREVDEKAERMSPEL